MQHTNWGVQACACASAPPLCAKLHVHATAQHAMPQCAAQASSSLLLLMLKRRHTGSKSRVSPSPEGKKKADVGLVGFWQHATSGHRDYDDMKDECSVEAVHTQLKCHQSSKINKKENLRRQLRGARQAEKGDRSSNKKESKVKLKDWIPKEVPGLQQQAGQTQSACQHRKAKPTQNNNYKSSGTGFHQTWLQFFMLSGYVSSTPDQPGYRTEASCKRKEKSTQAKGRVH
eukprot:1146613-Pelagomonas_calceolata.AAC.7